MYNNTATYFNISFYLGVLVVGCGYIYKLYKKLKKDNSNEEVNKEAINSNKNLLENISILQADNKKVPNLIVKQIIYQIFQILIMWYGIWWIIIVWISKGSFESWANMMKYGTLPVAIIEIFYIIKLFLYINYDNKLIKKYNINILEETHLRTIRDFSIFRPSNDTTLEKYFIVDSNKNLLYKVQKYGTFGKRYIVTDQFDNKVGEIIKKELDDGYIVRIIEEEPYYIRRKIQINYNYEILGNGYKVEGDAQAVDNLIRNEKGDKIAYVTANIIKNNSARLGNTKVEVLPGFENNQNIVFIALCITMGNFHYNQKFI